MKENELLEELKKNIVATHLSMMDAPYFGFSGDKIKGVYFAINKILEGTGITMESLSKEGDEKGWFRYKG